MEVDPHANVKDGDVRNPSNISLEADVVDHTNQVINTDHNGNTKVKDDILWKSVKHWAEYTTFHGIRNIFDEKTSIYRRGCWLIATCVFLILTVWVCQDQINRYLAYKTLTEDVSHFPQTVPFPAITICSCNQIKNDSIIDDRERQLLEELYVTKQSNSTNLLEELGTTFLLNSSLRHLFESSTLSVKELFRDCFWEGKEFNCSQAWIKSKTKAGYCFTFNSESSVGNTELKVVRMSGKNYGLHVMLWTNEENYFIHEDSCLGFKLMVHEPWEIPDVENTIAIGPGYTYHVAITKHKYTYLPYPVLAFGDQICFDKKAQPFPDVYKQYSIHYCIDQCRLQYIHKQCGCVGPLDEETLKECDPVRMIDCYRDADAEFPGHVEDCYCPVPCEVTDLQSEVTYAQFSPTFISNQQSSDKRLKDIDAQNIRENLVELKIFYANKVIKRHQQVLAVTFEDLWGNIQ